MKGEKQKSDLGKKVYWERRMTTEEREGEREREGGSVGESKR